MSFLVDFVSTFCSRVQGKFPKIERNNFLQTSLWSLIHLIMRVVRTLTGGLIFRTPSIYSWREELIRTLQTYRCLLCSTPWNLLTLPLSKRCYNKVPIPLQGRSSWYEISSVNSLCVLLSLPLSLSYQGHIYFNLIQQN